MGWEQIEKKRVGLGTYGNGWVQYPAVGISKSGFSLNKLFVDAFLGNEKTFAEVFVDSRDRRIGLKLCKDQTSHGFRIASKKGKSGSSYFVACNRLHRAFPDCVGKAFRAHLNAGEKIIEVDLSPKNEIK